MSNVRTTRYRGLALATGDKADADLVLWVMDATQIETVPPHQPEALLQSRYCAVLNKADLLSPAEVEKLERMSSFSAKGQLSLPHER